MWSVASSAVELLDALLYPWAMFAGIFCTFPLRHSVGFLVEWLYLLLDFTMVIFVHLWLSTVLMFYGKLSHDTFKKIYNFVVLVTCEVWRSRCLLPRKRASLEGSSRCHSLERTAFWLHFSTLHFAIITGHFHSALRWNISQHIEKSVFKKYLLFLQSIIIVLR